MSLLPLTYSAAPNELEVELKAIFTQLYATYIEPTDDDINLYGMPFLGSLPLIQRCVNQDGLSFFRNNVDDDIMTWVFKAWRYRNPRRGLHFTRVYLTALWGEGAFNLDQLWQNKSQPYPTDCKTLAEIAANGESQSDYFRTSRIRADVATAEVPQIIIDALRSTLPARLLLDMRVAVYAGNSFGMANISGGAITIYGRGIAS